MGHRKKKILMIASKAKAHINFRGDLTKQIIDLGYDVSVIVPHDLYKGELEKIGVNVIVLPYNKNSTSIFANLRTINQLFCIIKNEKPDKIFAYTIKPIILGSIAAHKAKVKEMYSMVTGLGHVYSDNSLKVKIIRIVCGIGYKLAFRYNKKVIFQNQDDIDEVVKRRYLKRSKCELVNGSGVNMNKFKRTPIVKENVFLMVSRVLREKGVIEYFEAARIMKEKYKDKVKFMFVGEIDKTNYAVDTEKLKHYYEQNIVEVIPETDDVAKYLKKCKVFVLPTYYREGVPRVNLEALSMGRPIITTCMPGCKETVIDKENGLFVKIKDVDDLVSKMEWMIKHPEKIEKMSDKSYELCKKKFEISIINKRMLEILEIK